MNIDALLEDYMKNPKWAGKIFMQDEKTCYIDGLIAGAKAMQEENEQLNYVIQSKIQEIDYLCNKYKDDISPRLKAFLRERKKSLVSLLHEEYQELVE